LSQSALVKSPTHTLARFVVETDDVPDDVLDGMRDALVDTLGVALAGVDEPCAEIARSVTTPAAGTDGASIWGSARVATPADAAFVNGIAGHALDFDDTLASMRGHSSVTTVPVALAIGEAMHASGKEILTALALGLEVAGKLGRSLGHGHYLKGWHSTATIGAFAATAVAGRLLRVDTGTLCRAWGIAAAQSAGLVRNFGTMAKPFQAGHAARAGVVATNLSVAGMTADAQIFDSPHGFLETYAASGVPLGHSVGELGGRWEVIDPGLNVKRWPCCYCCHRALGGLIEMLQAYEVEASDVISVGVGFPPGTDEPLIYSDPRTGLEAKFSIEYPVAALLLDGELTLQSFTDAMVQRSAVRELMKRVVRRRVPDERTYSGTVGYTDIEIATARGQWKRRIDKAPGSVQWPVTAAERRGKFLDCASAVLPSNEARALLDAAEGCVQLVDISSLVSLTIPARQRAGSLPGEATEARAQVAATERP
jgi:2-methylcitrate dehydratase PrpD